MFFYKFSVGIFPEFVVIIKMNVIAVKSVVSFIISLNAVRWCAPIRFDNCASNLWAGSPEVHIVVCVVPMNCRSCLYE